MTGDEFNEFLHAMSPSELKRFEEAFRAVRDDHPNETNDRCIALAELRAFGNNPAPRGRDRPMIAPPEHSVPRRAEMCLTFICRPKEAEAVLGDLQEAFGHQVARFGFKVARHWYWWQVARSTGPLLWAALWRMVAVKEMVKRLWPW